MKSNYKNATSIYLFLLPPTNIFHNSLKVYLRIKIEAVFYAIKGIFFASKGLPANPHFIPSHKNLRVPLCDGQRKMLWYREFRHYSDAFNPILIKKANY